MTDNVRRLAVRSLDHKSVHLAALAEARKNPDMLSVITVTYERDPLTGTHHLGWTAADTATNTGASQEKEPTAEQIQEAKANADNTIVMFLQSIIDSIRSNKR